MCRTREEAEAALAALRLILAELGLELKDAKTRIVHLKDGGEGVDFLGFHHRWVRATAPGMSSSSPAGPHARRCSTPATAFVRSRRANGCCFRSKTSAGPQRVPARLGGLFPVRKLRPSLRRDQQLRGPPRGVARGQAPQAHPRLWLVGLGLPVTGPSRAERPQRNRRRAAPAPGVAREMSRMPTVKNVGEPCAGEPHARIEVAAGGNQTSRASTCRAVQRLSPTLHEPGSGEFSGRGVWLGWCWLMRGQLRSSRPVALVRGDPVGVLRALRSRGGRELCRRREFGRAGVSRAREAPRAVECGGEACRPGPGGGQAQRRGAGMKRETGGDVQ